MHNQDNTFVPKNWERIPNLSIINIPKGGCMNDTSSDEKKSELKIFVFLTVFLAPLLSVLIVGGYGFLVWMSQILIGPPGPG